MQLHLSLVKKGTLRKGTFEILSLILVEDGRLAQFKHTFIIAKELQHRL